MEILERKLAISLGLRTYFTGRPCKNGHISYRYTEPGSCAECVNGQRNSQREIFRGARDGDRAERVAAAKREEEERRRLLIRRAEERERAKLYLRAHWVSEPDTDSWLLDRDLILYLAVSRCPSMLPEDVLIEETGTNRKIRLHPEDIATLEGFRESRYALSADDLIRTSHPVQVWYSRSDDSGDAYPYFEWNGNWYAVADIRPGAMLRRKRFGAPDRRSPLPDTVWGILGHGGPKADEIAQAQQVRNATLSAELSKRVPGEP